MNYTIIDTAAGLRQALSQLDCSHHLAVDTEFVRTRTLKPILGLLQISDGKTILLIDPIAIDDLQPFWDLMAEPSVIKVLHASGEDLDILIHQGKITPTPLFDTQLALAVLGEGLSVGYGNMVNARLGIEVDKSESRTDWTARPLTEKQLNYAAADVYYLWQIYLQIETEVHQRGLYQRVIEEGELAIAKRRRVIPDSLCYLNVKECWALKPADLQVLRALAAWRDRVARKRDKALNFVAKNAELMAIAVAKPRSFTQLKNVENVDIRFAQRYGSELLSVVEEALAQPEDTYPERVKRINDVPGYKAVYDKISKLIKQVANENGIVKEFLGSKKQVNEYLSYCWNHPTSKLLLGEKPDLLTSWRHELLADKLAKLDVSGNKTES